jgi:hypothetical protein
MDDARIRQLTEEVLGQIAGGGPGPSDLESRVAALEAAVARLQGAAARPAAPADRETHVHVHAHPSLQPLKVGPGSERCVVEPDRPCVQSGQCRALGH